jgi:hypothetical protein
MARGHLAAGRYVGHQDVGTVAELGGRGHLPRPQLEERRIIGHRGKHFRATFHIFQPGQPAQFGLWDSEVDLIGDAERNGHLLAKHLRDGFARTPAHDLPEDVAERVCMIGNLRARLPPGLGVGDGSAHLVPVTQVLWRRVIWYPRHTDRVRQDVPHGRGLLTVGTELGPHLDDRRVIAEQPTLHEHMRHGRGRALANRVAVDRRVRRDATPGLRVGDASDGVGHLLTVPVDGDLQAPLGSRFDQPVDGFLDLLLKVVHDPIPLQSRL